MKPEHLNLVTAILGAAGALCGLLATLLSLWHHRWDRGEHRRLEELARRDGREE